AGNYAATSLSAAYDWSAGSNTGGFDWSYPIAVPRSPGGLDPDVTFTYSSQSVDGLAASTNNQPSWLGRGWEWNPGYIEREFKECKDDGWPSGDLCWSDSNRIARMVLGGKSVTLVRSRGDDTWRAEDGDGWKTELVFGGWYAAPVQAPKYYWKVTATDGTQ